MARHPARRRLALLVLLAFAPMACEPAPTPPPAKAGAHEDLLIGYDLLADTLKDEGRLGLLKLWKKVTLRGPVEEVSEIMDRLGDASKRRSEELGDLRKLSPDVSAAPATQSPIGDAITAVAKDIGTEGMMDRSGAFDLRFVLLQAQATRMVAAMATAVAQFEPNAERKRWLLEVATEFEGYRDEIIEVIQKYVAGQGAAQQG